MEILTANKAPKNIPVRTISNYSIIVHANAAASVGYVISPTFLARAQEIIKGYEGQVVTIAGTGDCEELMRALGKALRGKLNSGRIDVPSSVGSSGGIKAVLAGKANLARVARDLKKAEAEAGLTCKTFALAPIVFVVHPSVTGIDNISSADIVGIYNGKITKWEMIGGSEGRIYAMIREPGDSCLQMLIERIAGFKDIAEPKAKVAISSSEARETIVSHVNTFGFLAGTVAVGTDLRILKVDGVYPSAESVRSGKYKLAVPLSVVYKGELTGLSRRFVDFLSSDEAKDIILKMGAVPLERAGK